MITDKEIKGALQHLEILNKELGLVQIDIGKVKNDIKWLKKLVGYMAVLMSGVFVSVLGSAIKYMFLS